MDVIHVCLSLAPVPYLSPAFSVFKFIWSQIAQVQASKQQLEVLARSLAQLLKALNSEYCAGRLLQARTSSPLDDLCRCVRCVMGCTLMLISIWCSLLKEISTFIQREASRGFLKLLFTKDQRITQIEGYHRRIGTSIESFQASCDLSEIVFLINMGQNGRYRRCSISMHGRRRMMMRGRPISKF
jgi:hypothetical protein